MTLAAVRETTKWHRPLMLAAAGSAVTAVIAVIGLIFDDRILVGDPIWLKPFKFGVSIAIYTVTIAWLLPMVRRKQWLMWWAGTLIAGITVLELAIIVLQVVRGQRSHFNHATPLDATLFNIMAVAISALWLINIGIAVALVRQRLNDRATATAIRLGLLLALIGMALGFLMPQLTSPDQLALLHSGITPPVRGAHSVGVPDGGPGLPLVGWSAVGGDLRIPHFVGMHALQALPLLALGLRMARGRLSHEQVRFRLVWVAGVTYAGVLAVLTWQALRGQSVVRPDSATLAALAVVTVVTGAGVCWALGRPAPKPAQISVKVH